MNIRKRISMLILSIMMIMVTMIPSMAFGQSIEKSITVEAAKTMELPDKVFSNQWSKTYDIIYRVEGTVYTYKGQPVTFSDAEHIVIDGQTYDVKSAVVNINGEVTEQGYNIKILPIAQPVGSISGAWNATYGGTVSGIYNNAATLGNDGILEGKWDFKSKAITFALTDVPKENSELKDGSVFEKANKWSPGFDFNDGKGVVQARCFGLLPNLLIKSTSGEEEEPDKYLGVNASSQTPNSFSNDIWTQYDFKELAVGETAKINPRRVPEAITDSINNNVELPHFNYEIIEGTSIEIDDSDNAHAVVRAISNGTSIVKITYDDFIHTSGTYFPASDDVNTQYVIFTVGNDDNIKINDNIDTDLSLKNAESGEVPADKVSLTSYDTIYFDKGETTPFEIKVTTENADRLTVKCNGLKVQPKDEQGKYVLPLENRSNIIEMTATDSSGHRRSLYRVIDARKIDIVVSNETHPGEQLKKGDTAKVSFVGLTMPVYKLATIYNPQMNKPSWGAESTSVNYELDGTTYKGHCSQWDLDKKNSFTVKLTRTGEYNFTNGKIKCQWWGSPLGSDKVTDNPGAPNLNAPVLGGYFSLLPDFSFDVTDAVDSTSITLNKVETKLVVGESENLTATVLPDNATNKEVLWSSDNSNVVSVDHNGKLTALAEGEATVTAENGSCNATCKVLVKAPELTKISFEGNKGKLYVGDTMNLPVNFTPANVLDADKQLVWSSSDDAVASVDQEGNIKGLKGGNVVITATSKTKPQLHAEFKLKVVEPQITELELSLDSCEMKEGDFLDLSYEVVPDLHKNRIKLKWDTSNDKVATVNSEGRIVAVGEGEAVITASVGNLSEKCKVKVGKGSFIHDLKAKFEPKQVKAGERITLNIEGLVVPDENKGKLTLASKFSFKTTIPGLKEVSSDTLGNISFEIPQATPAGTYYLTDGKYYLHTAAGRVQGYFPIGEKEVTLFEKQIPPLAFSVVNTSIVDNINPSQPEDNAATEDKNLADDTKLNDGWNKVGQYWYYVSNGKVNTGWIKLSNTWYHMDATGKMDTGWYQENGTWYYLDNSGAMLTGWYKSGGLWYYSNGSGAMLTGWIKDKGTWYYLSNSGAMVSGWLFDKGYWYYLDNSGAMVTGWLMNNGSWYYLGKYGAMATGWYKVGGTWYYSNSQGAMATGWIAYKGNWYYLKSSGAMVTGWHQIDYKWYHFDGEGALM